MKKTLHAFFRQAQVQANQSVAKVPQGQGQKLNAKLGTARTWIAEGLLAAAFGGAIYFLS